MKKTKWAVLLGLMSLALSCAGSSGNLKVIEEPKEGTVMIIGNIIVENINQEFEFRNWGTSAQVVFVGKREYVIEYQHVNDSLQHTYQVLA